MFNNVRNRTIEDVAAVSYTHLTSSSNGSARTNTEKEADTKNENVGTFSQLFTKMCIRDRFMTKDEDLYDKTIEDVFDDEVFNSTFWLYWRTMFAFENWHRCV